MIADARFSYLEFLRQGVALMLYPVQQAARGPAMAWREMEEFFASQERLHEENARLKNQNLQQNAQLQRLQSLQNENEHLRRLLNADPRQKENAVMAEVIYGQRDPFSHRIIVNRGAMNGMAPGQVVMDGTGVVGQITRSNPFTAEVTLITDKSQAVPVQVQRTGKRAILFGAGQDGQLDLPFMPLSTDIQNGDLLVTSGIDGIYPAGIPVAVVSRIERNAAYPFARITCIPSAGVDRNRQLLVLGVTKIPYDPPPAQQEKPTEKKKEGRRK
jgi:rod shape-determining protein MreC